MIKIFIADDHAVIRTGVKLYMQQAKDIEVVGEASDGSELLAQIKSTKPDVVLLDIDMPNVNGITLLRQIDLKFTNVKVIMLSMHPEEIYGKTTRKLGAAGYVSKSADPSEIIEAIRAVADGSHFFDNEIHEKGSDSLRSLKKLSKREGEVLKLLSSGKSNKEIANDLNISDKTVSTYKLRLMTKLGAKSLVDLVNFAQKYPFSR